MAQPIDFHKVYVEMCSRGCSDIEVAQKFGVTSQALISWFEKAKIVPENETEEQRKLREEIQLAREIGREARMLYFDTTGREAMFNKSFNNEMYKWQAQRYLGNFADYRIHLSSADLEDDF